VSVHACLLACVRAWQCVHICIYRCSVIRYVGYGLVRMSGLISLGVGAFLTDYLRGMFGSWGVVLRYFLADLEVLSCFFSPPVFTSRYM